LTFFVQSCYGGTLFYPDPICRPAPKVGLDGSTLAPLGRQIMRTDRVPRKLHKEREAEPAPKMKPDTRSPRVTTPVAPPLRPPPPPPLHPHCPNFPPPVEPRLTRLSLFIDFYAARWLCHFLYLSINALYLNINAYSLDTFSRFAQLRGATAAAKTDKRRSVIGANILGFCFLLSRHVNDRCCLLARWRGREEEALQMPRWLLYGDDVGR